MNEISITIGKKIKHYRRLKEITQADLGKALDVSSQQIHKYENGSNDISFVKLVKVSEFLGVSVNDLIGEQELPSDKEMQFLIQVDKLIKGADEKIKEKVIEFIKMMV
jgi:transcriptional regulator with XRE-family HTH domain